jgi:cell division protein FtsQ
MQLNMKRVYWTAGTLGVVMVLMAAIQEKRAAFSEDLNIIIQPLSNGESLIKESDVDKVLKNAFGNDLDDISITELDADRVEEALKEASFVKNADVYMDANGRLKINVTQREPVLRVIDSANDNYYLDAEGVRFPVTRHYTARVPVATGAIPPYVSDFLQRKKYMLRDVFEVARKLESDPLFNALTEQLYVSKSGELELTPKTGNFKILLGNASAIDDKLRRLEIFLKQGLPYTGWNKYRTISVQYKNQVVASRR